MEASATSSLGCLLPTKAGIYSGAKESYMPMEKQMPASCGHLCLQRCLLFLGGLNFASCYHQSSLQPSLKLEVAREVATQAPRQAPGGKIHTSVMVLCFLRSFAGASLKFLRKVRVCLQEGNMCKGI